MNEWWAALSTLQQVFYYIAVPFTFILLIQAVLSIIGLGGNDADSDADIDTDSDFDSDVDTDFDGAIDVDEFDIDADTDPAVNAVQMQAASFRFFTVRGIVAFFSIFGWTGLTLYETSLSTVLIILISLVAGFVAMFVIGLMFYGVKRLQSSGNIKSSNAIGLPAETYIPIPPSRTGKGKVMVNVQQRLTEFDAMTDENEKIKTGTTTIIVGNAGNILIVKRKGE
ncbi:MAG: hypothetical protein KAQ68_10980 [Clostridiales bacterium]|nr:hypothetical protein [Clostridiales bacterium]